MLHETGDNISGKQIDYDLPKLVILAENAFHVMGFNLFNIIYGGHIISPIFGKFIFFYTHIDARRYSISISCVGFGVRRDCTDAQKQHRLLADGISTKILSTS